MLFSNFRREIDNQHMIDLLVGLKFAGLEGFSSLAHLSAHEFNGGMGMLQSREIKVAVGFRIRKGKELLKEIIGLTFLAAFHVIESFHDLADFL
jgi:hypothetical protein